MPTSSEFRTPRTSVLLLGTLALPLLLALAGCRGVPEAEVQHREQIAAGRSSFRAYCAGCHGPEARGNGPAAPAMKITPADLTTISQRNGGTFPTERIFQRIDGYGRTDTTDGLQMLHFGDIWRGDNPTAAERQEVKQRIDELVAFIETLQR